MSGQGRTAIEDPQSELRLSHVFVSMNELDERLNNINGRLVDLTKGFCGDTVARIHKSAEADKAEEKHPGSLYDLHQRTRALNDRADFIYEELEHLAAAMADS